MAGYIPQTNWKGQKGHKNSVINSFAYPIASTQRSTISSDETDFCMYTVHEYHLCSTCMLKIGARSCVQIGRYTEKKGQLIWAVVLNVGMRVVWISYSQVYICMHVYGLLNDLSCMFKYVMWGRIQFDKHDVALNTSKRVRKGLIAGVQKSRNKSTFNW